jgi:hypothetical protein
MIKDYLSEIISKDPLCLLGLSKFDKSKFLYSIAPLRYENISNTEHLISMPSADIESTYSVVNPMGIFGEWSTEAEIFECSGCQIQSDANVFNDYVCSVDGNDWKIDSFLTLNKILSDENNYLDDITIMTLLKIEPELSELLNISNMNQHDRMYTYIEERITEPAHEIEQSIITGYLSETLSIDDFFDFTFDYSINDDDGLDVANMKRAAEAKYKKLKELRDNATIQLFKHSFSDENKKFIIDIKLVLFSEINKNTGLTGICGKLLFYVIYQNDDNNYFEKIEYDLSDGLPGYEYQSLADLLFNKEWHLLSFNIYCPCYDDDHEFVLSIFDGNYPDDPIISNSNETFNEFNQLIKDYEDEDELKFRIGGNGTKQMKMKHVFVFNRHIRPEEIKFLKLLLNVEN